MMNKIHEDSRIRAILKYTYFSGFIIFLFISIYLQSTEKYILKLVGGIIFSIYTLTGGIISIKLKLPIYGPSSTFFNIEKKDYTFFNAFSNIIVIVISIILLVISIKDANQF